MAKNILVTGGAGFIGSHLVDALVRQGFHVRVVDDFSTGRRVNILSHLSHVEFIELDLALTELPASLTEDIDVVFHLAALSDVAASIRKPQANQRNGEVITLRMLERCVQSGVKRFVLASSASVYGDAQENPKSESLTPSPLSPYAASKLA